MAYVRNSKAPPHQGSGAGIAIKGDAWVSGWYPAATELIILKKACSSQTQLACFLFVFYVFEKTRGISKQAHCYFLDVGVAR